MTSEFTDSQKDAIVKLIIAAIIGAIVGGKTGSVWWGIAAFLSAILVVS